MYDVKDSIHYIFSRIDFQTNDFNLLAACAPTKERDSTIGDKINIKHAFKKLLFIEFLPLLNNVL